MPPIQATPVDPRKAYNWRIEVAGLAIALVEKINIPELEYGSHEHAHGGQRDTTKTAGKKKYGDITLEKIMPADSSDRFFSNWEKLVAANGASVYKKQIDIFHLGSDETGKRIDHWKVSGAWPKKIEYGDHDANAEDDAIMETITLSVDRYERV